ncbi:MAG: sulfurtransferase [Gammaproteobacteria bacterium]
MANYPVIDAERLAFRLGDPRWRVVDCRFDLNDPDAGYNRYLAGHIPGARYAHLSDDLAAAPKAHEGRHPLPEPEVFAARLGDWGISNSTRIVVYDDQGGAIAARLWWMLRWVGHEHVAVLDGGLPTWRASGGVLEEELPECAQVEFFPHRVHNEWIVLVQDVAKLLESGSVLIDARSEDRYRGDSEPLDRVAGHVPGAINFPFSVNLTKEGRFRSTVELRAEFLDKLQGRTGRLIAMCGSGVTACHLLLGMNIAGLGDGQLFVGSWSQWIQDPKRPVAVGFEA